MNFKEYLAIFLFRHQLRGASRYHARALQGRRLRVKSRQGVVLRLDPHEYVDGFILRDGYYEQEVLDAILQSLDPDGVFWDVGSNLGLHSLTVAKLYPRATAYAFEPNPEMSALIRQAAEENNLTVRVLDCALDYQDGSSVFYIHNGNSGRSSLHNWDNDPHLKKIEVRTAQGDQIARSGHAPSPQVIKIDVEGNERRVLNGMTQILASEKLRAVIFEDTPDDSDVKTILRHAGFTITPLTRREATHHALMNFAASRSLKIKEQ